MKTYLIIFIIVLCSTCWLYDSGGPPGEETINITDTHEGSHGSYKEEQDSMFGDFFITDHPRDSKYVTKIDEYSRTPNMDHPLAGAQ